MIFLGHELRFWIAIGIATLLKVLTSKFHSPVRIMITVIAALFAAIFFTEPVLHLMQWEPDTYKVPTAALLALTGEGLMRSLVTITFDKLVKHWKDLRK